jgi:poly-gamma-glutamate capsule biosynthesis protein CapA/YwtB (metallophosphatase superfamily)
LVRSFGTIPPDFEVYIAYMNVSLRVIVLCLLPGFLWSQYRSDSCATVIFTGDLSFAASFEFATQHRPINVFANWKRIGAYDLMMVNLENAVTQSIDSMEKEFVFKMKPKYLSQLRNADISIVNCANNHAADFGAEGILETIHQLDSIGIRHTGIGRNLAEARKPVVLKVNDIRIGLLGYGGSRTHIASRTLPGTTSRSQWLILEDIKRLRPHVDFIVINLHWGNELDTEPDSDQIHLAHQIIEGGADLIVGHHPHVLQGIERYHGKIIAYSLGNFVFGGNSRSANSETAVLKVRFTKDTVEVWAVPVSVRNWQPAPAESSAAQQVLQCLQERSQVFFETISFTSLGVKYE